MPDSETKEKHEIYYFGCAQKAGHYLHKPGMRDKDSRYIEDWPFGRYGAKLDTTYTPKSERRELPNGYARCTIVGEWTVLSYWDNSVDHRPGSHSTFAMRGLHTPQAVLKEARKQFPTVFQRQQFPVLLEHVWLGRKS